MELRTIRLLFLAIMILGCSKSDPEMDLTEDTPPVGTVPQPEPEDEENVAPEQFSLLAVEDGATGVDVKPTLSWEVASDPNGDKVTYTLLVGETNPPENIVAEGLETNEFALTQRLNLVKDYHWQVLASDSSGATTSSEVRSFRTRNLRATNISNNLPFESKVTAIVFKEKIWVFSRDLDGDIVMYSSGDGINWNQHEIPIDLKVGKHYGTITLTKFRGELWIHGGYGPLEHEFSDAIWKSSDGLTWEMAVPSATYGRVTSHSTFFFENRLWLYDRDKMWVSNDAISWEVAKENPLPVERIRPEIVQVDSFLLLFGGMTGSKIPIDGVMGSEDGVNWSTFRGSTEFDGVYGTGALFFDGRLFILGGSYGDGRRDVGHMEIWSRKSSIEWVQETSAQIPKRRYNHGTVLFKDKIYVFAGKTGNLYDSASWVGRLYDLWVLD